MGEGGGSGWNKRVGAGLCWVTEINEYELFLLETTILNPRNLLEEKGRREAAGLSKGSVALKFGLRKRCLLGFWENHLEICIYNQDLTLAHTRVPHKTAWEKQPHVHSALKELPLFDVLIGGGTPRSLYQRPLPTVDSQAWPALLSSHTKSSRTDERW